MNVEYFFCTNNKSHNTYIGNPPEKAMEDFKETYICWSNDCVWQPFGTTMCILRVSDPEPGLIPAEEKNPGVTLSTGGRDIWELCDGTRTVETIINQLLEEYEGEPEEIRENVKNVIAILKEKEFVTFEKTPKKCDEIKIVPQEYVVWQDNVIWNEVEGQVLAMDNETGASFEFTVESGELWKLCNGKKSIKEILSILEERGIINEDMPASSFLLLVKRFVKCGMLLVKDAPAP
jgi:hypothetical protein